MKKLAAILAACVCMQGCTTISAAKTIIVTPEAGETKIPVTANAVSRCGNFVVFWRCTITVEIERAK